MMIGRSLNKLRSSASFRAIGFRERGRLVSLMRISVVV
jgi:hypothetical protein